MKAKTGIYIALLLAIGLLALVFLQKGPKQILDFARGDYVNESSAKTKAASESGTEHSGKRQVVRTSDTKLMDSATSFGKLNDLTAKRLSDEAVRAEYMRQAALLCEEATTPYRKSPSTAAKLSTTTYVAYINDFCRDFTGSSDAYLQLLYKAPPESEIKQALVLDELAVDEQGKRLATARAMEIIAGSNEALAVQAAARYLGGESVELFGDKYVESGSDHYQTTEAQMLAAKMLACDLGGGCSSGGYYTMIECASAGVCGPGVTLDQVWRKTYSPKSYALARRIYGGLLEMRAQG